jgi:PD-(D/E)XK nuclease superfamily protein
MVRRDTGTGAVLEQMVLPALVKGGYSYRSQIRIGERFGGGSHFVDIIAEKGDERLLISMKWQQVSGTAEQKVPFELICLEEALKTGDYQRAFIVLGGDGWKLRTFYVGGGLNQYLKGSGNVQILTLETFVARANMGKL